jgi:hypothetical protein
VLVPGGGVEPPRAEARRILSPSSGPLARGFSNLEAVLRLTQAAYRERRA